MKLLIVEDETRMADLLQRGLTEEGHTAMCAFDGAEGLALAKAYEFDVIILDVMLPKLNGYEVAKRLRSEKNRTPILMLTAKDAVPDIVHGLDLGADDYMTKPFSFDELLARLRTVKRVIALMSGKGGVGKSYVVAHLAQHWARSGSAVGVLDGHWQRRKPTSKLAI